MNIASRLRPSLRKWSTCIPGIAAVLMLVVFCGCEDNESDVVNGTVSIEVDYTGYNNNPYGTHGQSGVRDIINGCCKPKFFEDEVTLFDTMIFYTKFGEFFEQHKTLDKPYYLAGISQFKDEYGDPMPEYAGRTYQASIGNCYSFVCIEVTDDYPDAGAMAKKTCCHELGHQLAWLQHLCSGGHWLSNIHSDESCLMGQGDYQQCGSHEDLLESIHFCDYCTSRLCKAKGIEEGL